jgi:D-alanyl-D-alanine endopeptidase (penicillin-binding protein 7)
MSWLAASLESSIPIGFALCVVALLGRSLVREARQRYAILYAALLLMPVLPIVYAVAFAQPQGGGFSLDEGWLLTAWLVGFGLALVRVLASVSGVRLSLSKTTPLDVAWIHQMVLSLSEKLSLSRLPSVRISAAAISPYTVGVIKPLIVFPAALLARLSAAEVEAILAHELAHIKRFDYLANMIQMVVESLLFFHPGVWLISHLVRHERELSCDDMALELIGDRRSYAFALAATSKLSAPIGAPAFAAGQLSGRIARVVGHPAPLRLRLPKLTLTSVVALLLMGVAVCVSVKPYVAPVHSGLAPAVSERKPMRLIIQQPLSTDGKGVGMRVKNPIVLIQ